MKPRSMLYSVLVVAGISALVLGLVMSAPVAPAFAQPNPQPQDCVCSPGVNIAAKGAAVMVHHCQCGILSCAVVAPSGQLQCVR